MDAIREVLIGARTGRLPFSGRKSSRLDRYASNASGKFVKESDMYVCLVYSIDIL